jgi:hypothetical protein
MTRPVKYRDADTLFANCSVRNDCIIWNNQTNAVMPTLAAASPMSQKFATNSIARIIFTICRFVPASKRLIRWCTSDFCINPYHHAEARPYQEKRKKQFNIHDELPEQTSHRHLIAPPDEELIRMKPTDPEICAVLMRSAATAGHDAKGIPNRRFLGFPTKGYEGMPLLPEGENTAKENVPVLIIKKKPVTEPLVTAPKGEYDDMNTDEFFDALDKKVGAMIEKNKEKPHIDYTKHLVRDYRNKY